MKTSYSEPADISLRQNQRKTENRIAITAVIGLISAAALKSWGQSESIWTTVLIITGFLVTYIKVKEIENRMIYFQEKYYMAILSGVNSIGNVIREKGSA